MSNFQIRLREALSIRKLKQVDLVDRTGFSKSRISQYVNGVYEPKPDALFAIAKVLDVDERWLIGQDFPMNKEVISHPANITKEEQTLKAIQSVFGQIAVNLVSAHLRLNPEGQRKLYAYAIDLLENSKNVANGTRLGGKV